MSRLPRLIRSTVLPTLFLLAAETMTYAQAPADAAREVIFDHEQRIRPLEIAAGRAWWDANVTGADEAFQLKEETENKLDAVLGDRERFAKLKKLDQAKLKDPLLARQIHILYLQALPKRVDPDLLKQMVARGNAIEKRFGVFRAKVEGKELPDSEVRKILKQSRDTDQRRAIWEASKEVGCER